MTPKELTNIFINTCETWVDKQNINEKIFNDFSSYVDRTEPLRKHEINIHMNNLGYGEKCFWFLWHLLVNEMPKNFKFLEIGVYKGSILSLIQLCSNILDKNPEIIGLTPLSTNGDKYLSSYEDVDYLNCIGQSFFINELDILNTTIINGLSTDERVKSEIKTCDLFDIVYIDGCHDYEVVMQDIEFVDSILKDGAFMVMDDASSHLNFDKSLNRFNGHEDVAKAIDDSSILNDYEHLFACGHNRVWRKV